MTNTNKPSVKIFIGKVKKIKTGFITILTKAIAIDAIKAVMKFEIVIPGTIQPTNIIINDNANHFNNNIINLLL